MYADNIALNTNLIKDLWFRMIRFNAFLQARLSKKADRVDRVILGYRRRESNRIHNLLTFVILSQPHSATHRITHHYFMCRYLQIV
jgi:hypothetical protein